jgi:hypothetical protein
MKYFIPAIIMFLLLGSCRSSKNYLEREDEDKALSDAVKKLSRSPSDQDAKEALPILYSSLVKTHKSRIKSYENSNDISRWDKIIKEYNYLQDAYNSIINSTPAFKLITPENFSTQLLEAKQNAAADYYQLADTYLDKKGRANAKSAYNYFKKTERYVPGYKDVNVKLNTAYENAVIDVVINPVQDDSYFYNSGWGSSGYNYSNEYFQRTLVRDLDYNNGGINSRYAARFFTDWEARRSDVKPDWIVDLRLRNINLPMPSTYTYRRNRSAQVQNGTDTSGKPIYKTVTAIVNVTRQSFTATASMDVYIKDLETQRMVSSRNFREDYRWQDEIGSYSGDSRALTNEDWQLVNNRGYNNTPRRDDVLQELYRKIYPQVLNNIKYAVDW